MKKPIIYLSMLACSTLISACGSGGGSEPEIAQNVPEINQAAPVPTASGPLPGSSSNLPIKPTPPVHSTPPATSLPGGLIGEDVNQDALSETATATPNEFRLGTQVAKIQADMTAWSLADLMKASGVTGHSLDQRKHGWFVAQSGAIDEQLSEHIQVDAQGWPTSMELSNGRRADAIFTTVMSADIDHAYAAGTYTFTFEGEGELVFENARVISEEGQQILLDYAGQGAISVAIVDTDPRQSGNYLRNLRLLRPQSEMDGLFTQSYLNYLKPAKVVRPALWHTPASLYGLTTETGNRFDAQGWADRVRLSHSNWGTEKGAPYELMIELANQSASHLWLNLPLAADNEYLQSLAQLLHTSLNSNRVVYLELGNELAKRTFPQRQGRDYALTQALTRWPDAYSAPAMENLSMLQQENLLISNWQAARTLEVKALFNDVWKDDAARVISVLAGTIQDAKSSVTYNQQLLEGALLTYFEGAQAPGEQIDALAVDPLVLNTSATQFSIDSAQSMLSDARQYVDGTSRFHEQGEAPGLRYGIRQAATLTGQYNIALTAYAGGHGFDASSYLNYQVIKSAEMYDLYELVFDVWNEENGGLFVAGKGISTTTLPTYCNSASSGTKALTASIGLKETMQQHEQDAPMYRAWRDQMRKIGQIK
ncbi:hypothetical protein IT774_11925 [Salinimonas marina]|uniref:Uncharacterized protein n=1 Tax=Salinimonas marina TaxID=2785918 RepID=A0A7S9DX45_9ALTE|nr:hypothetical protein [Salinimonas marina]QPG04870.1 hypothetical protein IT774_11925 [Salinimonas marina]